MYTDQLDKVLEEKMEILADGPNLEMLLKPGFADKRLYAIYLAETYQYTLHNARNQALVATRKEDMNHNYMKYCLKHAAEEVGHEMMAFHDLKKLGYEIELNDLPRPLNSTQSLVSYLYYVSENFDPVARLGYSFWAERSYQFITPLFKLLTDALGLPKSTMTFLTDHAEIDHDHAKAVINAINRFVKTQEQLAQVEEVMINSLILTAKMMDDVFAEYVVLKETNESRYSFLKD